MRALGALIAALLLAACGEENPESGNAQGQRDYCPYGEQSWLFLMDRTSPYDANDERVLLQSIGAVVDGLGVGDRLVISTISSHYSRSETVFNGCRPGCPTTSSPLGDMSTGCSGVVALADEQAFRRQLIGTLRPLMANTSNEPSSDITGTIAQATKYPPGGRSFSSVYIFSDMLENSQVLPWQQFQTQSVEASLEAVRNQDLLPSVSGAHIRIVGFGRYHSPARGGLEADVDHRVRAFWQNYFREGQGQSVSFEGTISQAGP